MLALSLGSKRRRSAVQAAKSPRTSVWRKRGALLMVTFVIRPARKPRLARLEGEWLPLAKLDEIPLTAAHRKVAGRLWESEKC